MKRVIVGVMIVVAFMFSLSVPTVFAQDMCVGDFDYDGDCDGTDATTFKSDFSRGGYNNPCPPNGPAPVAKTGQTTSHATGDDGEYQTGVAWPNPRFTDNLDGTVTDNLTGLIWLKDARCFGYKTWNEALEFTNALESGQCGLSDGSIPTDWRLPNLKELLSLVDITNYLPALPSDHPFERVPNDAATYWSSSSSSFSDYAWYVQFYQGFSHYSVRTALNYVWPVRGGH